MELHGKKGSRARPAEIDASLLISQIASGIYQTSFDLARAYLTKENCLKAFDAMCNLYVKRREEYYDIDEFGMDRGLVETLRPLFEFLYRDYWRVDVEGIENIPSKGSGIIVSNHSGTIPFDSTMVNMAIWDKHPKKRFIRFLVEDFVYYFPFLGTFMNRVGAVRACQENAERLIKNGELVAVFPEGVKGIGKLYSDRYKLLRLGRGGFIKLAIKTKTPIIPTAVIGAEEIYPIMWKTTVLAKPLGVPYLPVTATWPHLGLLGLIPLPSKWRIIFGKPIDLSKYSEKDLGDELLIHRLSESVRKTMQKMIAQGLKKRGNPWK